MTGPKEPGEDDWGFPEVDPASTQLPPPPEEEAPAAFDTGSDAWWRAQAQAQRLAAADEPAVPPVPPFPPAPPPPPELVEPEVLSAPSPLDEGWLPPELPAEPVEAPVETPVEAPDVPTEEPVAEAPVEEPVAEAPVEEPVAAEEPPVTSPDWYRGLVEPEAAAAAAEAGAPAPAEAPMPELTPPPVEDEPRTREPYEGQRVGPARAAAGAALALLGVVLAVVALIVFNGGSEPKGTPTVAAPPTPSHTPTASASPSTAPVTQPSAEPSAAPTAVPSTAPTAAAPATAPVVPITVLNNTRRTGFAKVAAARFEAGGWPVPTTGNYRGRISQTTIYYAAGQLASAQRFARQFHVPRVLPRSALPGIPSSGTTVVLTRDYAF